MRSENQGEGRILGLESHRPGFLLHPVGIKELGRFLWGTGWDPTLTGFRKTNMVATVCGSVWQQREP